MKNIRIRTKWRKYNELSAYKQGLNAITNEIMSDYKGYNFGVEKLLFKGRKGRSRSFRRNNNNWSYNSLINKLEEHGKTEGFKVVRVNPAYTSQTCPNCGCVSRLNRNGDRFYCMTCGFKSNADVVGAINILERVNRELPSPEIILDRFTHVDLSIRKVTVK